MKTYEYKYEYICYDTDKDLIKYLNVEGNVGWDLCSMKFFERDAHGISSCRAYFKREVIK